MQIIILNAHSADTLFDTVTQTAYGQVQKTLRGTVTAGYASGPVAPGTMIVFKTPGNWVFAAVSNTAGNYSIVGLPTSVATIPAYAALSGMGLMATPAVGLTVSGWTNIQSYTNAAAINIAGSSTLNITLPAGGTPPPAAPVLATNSFTPSAANTLTWQAVATATSYTMQASTSSTFATTIAQQTGLTGTSASVVLGSLSRYYWRVSATNTYGTGPWSNSGLLVSTSALDIPVNEMKAGFTVRSSEIVYSLAKLSPVEIVFYDIMGKTAFTMDRMQSAGSYKLTFKSCRLASGHYLVRFKAAGIERRSSVMVAR